MMKRIQQYSVVLGLLVSGTSLALSQSPADSAAVTFRYHDSPLQTVFVPGEFNGWGPNNAGVISPGAISQMSYNPSIGAWIKTYVFKIHDQFDVSRTLRDSVGYGDSVYQYKFNINGSNWLSDPLHPEQNPNDNHNSVLRLSDFAWFEFFAKDSSGYLTQIAASLIHKNSDSVTSVSFESTPTQSENPTILDVTGSYHRSSRVVSFSLAAPIPKNYAYRLVAKNQAGDSVIFKRSGYSLVLAQLPAYAKRGVTLPDDSAGRDSTTFRFQIPGKSIVLVRVGPVGQTLANVEPVALRRNSGSEDWWINMLLAPGTYEYLFEFEDGKTIYDPWGRQNGAYGTRFTVGPEGLTADNYNWTSTPYQRPPANRLVIYELNVREFAAKGSAQGKFKDLIPLLAHFNSLGVNAIELMPINDYGNIGPSNFFSWGYDLSHHFALEPSYGTPADFKELVDSAHARGIAVIVDVVFNHLNDPAPLWQMIPNEAANPYFKQPPLVNPDDRRSNEDDLAFFKDMDLWTPEAQQYVDEVLKMWLDEYRVDGFRYDYTQGIGWSMNDTTGGILGWTRRIRREYGSGIIQIAEHLPESPALIYYGGLTGGWHDSFRDEIFDDARFQNTSLTDFENLVLGLGAYPGNDAPATPSSYADRTQPVNATVNHDEQSLVYELLTFQGVTDTLEALIRDRVYAVMMFTSLGIPMVWQGMEYGEARGWHNDSEKLSYRPVQWSRQYNDLGQWHFQWYKALAYQRRFNPALYDGELKTLYRYDPQRTLVWGMSDSVSGAQVMVVANLSNNEQTITNIPWLSTGTWYDVINRTGLEVTALPISSFVVPRWTARVFSNKTDSALGMPVFIDREETSSVPPELSLDQNYPNPFNPQTTIRFRLPSAGMVTLKIYDILGREVSTLVHQHEKAGATEVFWNGRMTGGSVLPSGVYVAVLSGKNFSLTRKMLLLR